MSDQVDEKAESYIDAYVSLSDDTEIEGCEWMQYGDEQVLRVKIQYKEQPENAYRHKAEGSYGYRIGSSGWKGNRKIKFD